MSRQPPTRRVSPKKFGRARQDERFVSTLIFNNKQYEKVIFERLTGSSSVNDEEDVLINANSKMIKAGDGGWMEESDEEAELTVDVYQTPTEVIVKSMIAGVKPEDLQISITRDAVTIKGRRNEEITVNEENYFHKGALLGFIFKDHYHAGRS